MTTSKKRSSSSSSSERHPLVDTTAPSDELPMQVTHDPVIGAIRSPIDELPEQERVSDDVLKRIEAEREALPVAHPARAVRSPQGGASRVASGVQIDGRGLARQDVEVIPPKAKREQERAQ